MKYKREIIITLVIALLVLFLKQINVLQITNGLGYPIVMILMILFFSFFTITIQNDIDKNQKENKVYYQNLDILKYFCAILILLLHLRPFSSFSDELDLAFNNIITRICVPIFFLITGYFVAKKEKKNENYIKDYIKRTIPFYLAWSLLYVPILIGTIIPYVPTLNEWISKMDVTFPTLILLFLVLFPIVLLILLCYVGVYYHLWYFPALLMSLVVLGKWKKKIPVNYLFVLSFFFLLFGATETYYGVLPKTLQELLTYYYSIFFTTRNFLFFGLFYVVLGYVIGTKEKISTKYCFVKLIVSFFFLIFEAILLHDTKRLNSNILLSCVPLTYYLFLSVISMTNQKEFHFPFGPFSKYYYLIHPMVIFVVSLFFKDMEEHPYWNFFLVLLITHILSAFLLELKKKKKFLL